MANDASTVFDLVILGGGSGGYAAALRGAQLGLDVALIEKNKLGGTCLHNGCIPTKALLHAGEIADQAREAAQFGVKATLDGIDIEGVHKYKDEVISGLYKGLQGLVASRKVTYIEGEGRLSSPTSVDVNGQRVQGRHILLATGSVPKSLPGLTIDGDRIISSDHALKLDRVPKSAIVLGGGVIGVEFASAWKSFGTDVTIVEGLKHLVPVEDENSSKLLERAFRKRGIKFNLGTFFDKAEYTQDGVKVTLADGKSFEPRCCWSPSAAARSPRAWATRRPGSPWTAATSWSTSTCRPTCRRSRPSVTSSPPSSSRTSASPRASWWRSGWPASRPCRSTTTACRA